MKVLIIGASHGNELLGIKLYMYLLRSRSELLEHVDFIVGNPRAYSAGVRYTECDLNRSYGVEIPDRYEVRRANEIQQYIGMTQPDIVLDMHTTNCEQPNCLIVHGVDGKQRRQFLRACHIDTILQVQPMHDSATLGDNVIGYEVPNRAINPQLLKDICDDIARYITNSGVATTKQLYVMQDKIYKAEVTPDDISTFINFEEHSLGFVPIMTGNNSYTQQTDYVGFRANRPKTIKL